MSVFDFEKQAREHNEANHRDRLAHGRAQDKSRVTVRRPECPRSAVKIAEGVYQHAGGIFVGDFY